MIGGSFFCCLQKHIAFDKVEQVQDRPCLVTSLIGSCEEAIAAHDRLWRFLSKFLIRKPAKPVDVVDNKARRYLSVIDRNDTGRTPE